jgi:hypothetical protein
VEMEEDALLGAIDEAQRSRSGRRRHARIVAAEDEGTVGT